MSLPDKARIRGRDIRCEYEDDSGERCQRRATSVDHFTPQCIARDILGWTAEQVNASDNLQYLCQEHHSEKDSDTSARKELLHLQLSGQAWVGFGEHDQVLEQIAASQRTDRSVRDRLKNEMRRAAAQPRAGEPRLRRAG